MRPLNTCTWPQVMQALEALGIPYTLVGPERELHQVCSMLHKQPHGLYYYTGSDPGILGTLEHALVICKPEVAAATDTVSCLAVDQDPQLVFYKVCGQLFRTRPAPGIHPTAIVHPEAEIAAGVHIGPYCVIERCVIGADAVLRAHVVVNDGCSIGARTVIESHSCIGGTGVAWVWDADGSRVTLPQVGGVHLGDDVFLGTDVTVVRGMLNEVTTIEDGCMIAHGTKIGHSVWMGRDCHVANNVSIAGSARIGSRSFLGAGCSIRPHTKLADKTIVGVGAAVVTDVTEPGRILAGVPARIMEAKERPSGMPRPH